MKFPLSTGLIAASALALTACGGGNRAMTPVAMAPAQMTQIGVNAYLWQAAIDTLSFAPLLQADASNGIVLTDWYANPNTPGERIKLTAAILDASLRSDAVRVTAAREVLKDGMWVAAPVEAATVQKLEDIILTRARDIRRTTIAPAG
ncbi:DUF3576 domain-containing protein [Sphingomicrobium astaxanthinifaciens]|uniref:DUF3576 domain-containing protein n=1 Tax=Sphingomicrobium astaxanthinifaciens TaxID=1227949 RepID=UPI001FCAFCB9|nr:DUF3576 domain-containing protein [Sphingomicrobium astaxanthinifaciens]MCJ7421185.1 DUF3576 domain-containing protein [Sphingomicrobium astaxanthinifaciens]